MKKTVIIAIAIILYTSLLPVHLFAEENSGSQTNNIEDQEENKKEAEINTESQKEINELGIKVGTKVYGEDISNLSKEELQYIPKGWRDGSFEGEHPQEPQTSSSFMKGNHPDVNDYIFSKQLTVADIEKNHKSIFPKFNYRNGLGKVEGVVAHETANENSTITEEIDYMVKNYNNAFVHAFVDHSRIIEIHPTNYAAWGAGRYANERFVHVELVEVDSFKKFAKSINNYSDYLASILDKYELGVTSAESNGKGSLWSHNAVSKFLGGTDHVDPHGYFAKWGYNWNEFVKLVTLKYNKLAIEKDNTSKLGHIRSSNSRIYDDPINPYRYDKAGKKYTNSVYYIKKQAKLDDTTYYLLSDKPSSKKGTIGWIKARDVNVYTHKGIDSKNKLYSIKGSGKAYSKAWGGSKELVYDLSSLTGSTFKVNLTESVGTNVWYRGMLNGKQVWIHSSYLTTEEVEKSFTSLLGHLSSTARIYKDIDNHTGFKYADGQYTNQVYYIKKKAVLNDELYYLISYSPSSLAGVVGWVLAVDMQVYPHTGVDNDPKSLYVKGTGSSYNKAWGGTKNLVHDNLVRFVGREFKVNLTEKVGNNTWYRGKINNKQMWIHSSYLSNTQWDRKSMLGKIKTGNVKIYKSTDNLSGYAKSGNKHTNKVYYIKAQTVVNGQVYYNISNQPSAVKGVVGWVKADDLSTNLHVGVDYKAKTFYFDGTGSAYSKAWGDSKDIVHRDLSKYKGREFKVHLTEKVGNEIWYRGNMDGETVWVQSSHVTEKEEQTTSKLGHIRYAGTIYKRIGDKSSSYAAAGEYTNQVYYIKKQANINGEKLYLISNKPSYINGVVGWVKAEDMVIHSHTGVNNNNKTLIIKGTGSAYSKAWGGSKDLVYKNLSKYKFNVFKVNLTEKVGNNVWYRGTLNGKTAWIHSSYITTKEVSSTSRLGHIRYDGKIYSKLHSQSSFEKAADGYINQVYYIKSQAVINKEKYYLISKKPSSVDGIVGWVRDDDLVTHPHSTLDHKTKTFYLKGTGNAYGNAWGGSRDLVYDLTQYKDQEFKVDLTETVGSNTWYRGKLQGETVWVHSSYLSKK